MSTTPPSPTPHVRFPSELPITARIGEIVESLRRHPVLIVAGETGSGKTTQLPKACLAAGLGSRGIIAHTQPRRLAARTVAARIAEELGVELGAEVGYAVRFSERVSEKTRVKVMTDGLLLNDIQRDRRLERYDCVIVDEAHERSLNVDFILGYLRWLLDRRTDLKVVVTSATIDVDAFASHFGDAPVVEVSGRGFPVDVVYRPEEADAQQALVDCLRTIAGQAPVGDRDILVFQSGEREIFETSQLLRREFPDRFEILPLYARLPAKDQQRIFAPGGRQRVVLATNVAETSITVPNIGYVVDPGFARVSRYSYRAKLQRLPVEPISQASARQRAGRCGRVAPGVCYRLYGEQDFEDRPAYTDPELTRTNLASVVLAMRAFRLGDIESFPFIDSPAPRAVRDAIGLLHELQALENDDLTPTGRTMARLPVDPRLARMLIEGAKRDCGALSEVLIIASALAAQDSRLRPMDRREAADRAHAEFADPGSDFLAYVNLWGYLEEARSNLSRAAFRRLLEGRFLSPARVREWRALHRQLLLACRDLGMRVNRRPASYAAVHRALLSGSLGFIGVEREASSGRGSGPKRRPSAEYDGARGLRFRLFPGSALARRAPKWVVAAEVSDTGRTYARCVAGVEPEWIEKSAAHLLRRSYSEPFWDDRRGEAMVREQVSVYGLTVVGERPRRAYEVDPEGARRIFVREALVGGDRRIEAAFLERNEQLRRRIEERQAKSRRADLLAGESVRVAFYLERLPVAVCSIATCNEYTRKAWEVELARLEMTEDDLAAGEAGYAEDDFPTRLAVGGGEMQLAYRFAPGEPDDGVSLRVEAGMLGQLDAHALAWLVPGFFEDKCLALVRALPKTFRRRLAPARDRLHPVIPLLAEPGTYRCGTLAEALSKAVHAIHGVAVPVDAWREEALPEHLRINIQVRDRRGRMLDQGRDLVALKSRVMPRVERSLGDGLRAAHERHDITEFPAEGVPDSITIVDGGNRTVVHPVLVDRGRGVDLLVQTTPRGRASLDRDGFTRLAVLADAGGVRRLRREVDHDLTLALHYAPLGNPADLADGLIGAAYWFACFDGRDLPRTKADFDRRLVDNRSAVPAVFAEMLGHARDTLHKRLDVAKRIESLVSPAFAPTRDDLAGQLQDLVPAAFVRSTPRARLADLPRYLDGMLHRIGNLQGRVRRDRAGIEAVADWDRRLAALQAAGRTDLDELAELRFLLQEYRIGVFAQHLGTRQKVSPERLKMRFDAVSEVS
ncbi:MAG: ATP-dependent RNA helicase HrpA [Gammaproteobacteria bacterium]|nr:ATP-dependent RNA helicase HrpA [Gammaproteobacteria bacterium]